MSLRTNLDKEFSVVPRATFTVFACLPSSVSIYLYIHVMYQNPDLCPPRAESSGKNEWVIGPQGRSTGV